MIYYCGGVVRTVFDLFAVTRRLLESLDDEGCGGRYNRDGGLPVLYGQLHRDLEPLPVGSRLGYVVTNLLR